MRRRVWKTKRSWFLEAIAVTYTTPEASALGDQLATLMQQRAAQGKKCSPALDVTIHAEKGEVPMVQLLAGMPEGD